MTNEKQLRELFKYIEQKWDVAVESSHKTDIKRIFGGVLCEDIMNDTLHEVKAEPYKVQISKHTLVEVNRAFRALREDQKSYVHKVFADDDVFDAMNEIRKLYEANFGKKPNEQVHVQPQPKKISSQAILDNSFDKERFERLFCAVVASGRTDNEFIETEEILNQLDAYYASKEGGENE